MSVNDSLYDPQIALQLGSSIYLVIPRFPGGSKPGFIYFVWWIGSAEGSKMLLNMHDSFTATTTVL